MMNNTRLLAVILLAVSSVSCSSAGRREPFPFTPQPLQFSAQVGQELVASAGDSVFVSGQTGQRHALEMSDSISSTMPGAYGLPFDFSIERCSLQGAFQTAKHKYFAAPYEKCDARHSMLGKVIVPGDSVGVRISRTTGEREWYVDNSRYNRMDTVWHRRVKEEDNISFSPVEVAVIDESSNMTSIVYDGFYSGLLHFTFREVTMGDVRENEFKFDVAEGQVTPVNIRGNIFEVLRVDNLGMVYRWVEVAE